MCNLWHMDMFTIHQGITYHDLVLHALHSLLIFIKGQTDDGTTEHFANHNIMSIKKLYCNPTMSVG